MPKPFFEWPSQQSSEISLFYTGALQRSSCSVQLSRPQGANNKVKYVVESIINRQLQ